MALNLGARQKKPVAPPFLGEVLPAALQTSIERATELLSYQGVDIRHQLWQSHLTIDRRQIGSLRE